MALCHAGPLFCSCSEVAACFVALALARSSGADDAAREGGICHLLFRNRQAANGKSGCAISSVPLLCKEGLFTVRG